MIGERVRWKHLNPDGTPAVALEGKVIAYGFGGHNTRCHVLVQLDDGSFKEADAVDLIGAATLFADGSCEADSCDQLDQLKIYLENQFTCDDSPVAHQAVQLISELKNELLAVGESRDNLQLALADAQAALETARKDKRKPKGPAGPGE